MILKFKSRGNKLKSFHNNWNITYILLTIINTHLLTIHHCLKVRRLYHHQIENRVLHENQLCSIIGNKVYNLKKLEKYLESIK